MARVEQLVVLKDDRSKGAVGTRRHDDIQIALAFFMVDPHLRLANPCEREAIFTHGERKRSLPRQNRIGIDGIARMERESFTQRRLLFARFGQALEIDRGKQIARPRHYLEPHGQPAFLFRRDGNGATNAGRIIALRTQQPVEQLAIFLDPPVYLREICGLPFPFPQHGQLFEAAIELRVRYPVQAIELNGITLFLTRIREG